MSSIAAKSKPVRRAVGAVIVPVERLDEWYARASAVPGLDAVELGVLAPVADHYRQLAVRGYGSRLSYDRLGHHLDVDPVRVKWGVNHLVELGLLAVQPGGGQRPNEYRPCLPRRTIASLSTAAAVDDAPPF